MGLEGVVAPYRSGPSRAWVKARTRQAMRCAGARRRSGA
jgi:hypothetical protein